MQKTFTLSTALAALVTLGSSAFAQTPPPPPAHPGFLHNLFHHNKPGTMTPGHMMPGQTMPGRPGMGGMTMGGGVIGNKNTRVYHLPGDRGALPDPKNRVYFHTAAQAEAAGFHRAGGGVHTMMRPRMHGSPVHGTMMRPMPGTMTR